MYDSVPLIVQVPLKADFIYAGGHLGSHGQSAYAQLLSLGALVDCPLISGSLKGTVSNKSLDEPANAPAFLQAAVAFLRYAAPRLGREWRYYAAP